MRCIDSCITQLKVQGPCGTCNESREKEEDSYLWTDDIQQKFLEWKQVLLHCQPTGPNSLNHRDEFSRPALRHGTSSRSSPSGSRYPLFINPQCQENANPDPEMADKDPPLAKFDEQILKYKALEEEVNPQPQTPNLYTINHNP